MIDDPDDEQPPKREPKRTIPQIREAADALLDRAVGVFGPNEIFAQLRELMEETKRRPPVRAITRKRHPDPTPQMVRLIRRLARLNPDMGYAEMAARDRLDTSVRCVSFAIAGKRDGSPIWSGPEYQPDYSPEADDETLREMGLLPAPDEVLALSPPDDGDFA